MLISQTSFIQDQVEEVEQVDHLILEDVAALDWVEMVELHSISLILLAVAVEEDQVEEELQVEESSFSLHRILSFKEH